MDTYEQKKAILAAIVGNSIFGFSFMFSKIALDMVAPFTLMALRMGIAFIIMNLLILFGIAKVDYRRKPIKKLLYLGISHPVLYFIFESYGIANANSMVAGVLMALVPIGALLLARILLKETISSLQGWCALISLIGVVLISVIGGLEGDASFLGILFLLGAVFMGAFYNIFSRDGSVEFTAFERTYGMFAMGSLFFLILAVVQMEGHWIEGLISPLSNGQFLLAILYLAAVSSVIAFFLLNYAVTKLPVAKASAFTNLTSIISVFAGVIFLRENFTIGHFIGCIMIIIGVYGVNRSNVTE